MLKSLATGLFAAALSFAAAGAALAGPKVVFETNLGAFTVELEEKKAPKTVANFLGYVDSGHYDGVAFHRVIPNFMAQGGGFAVKDGEYREKKTRAPIVNEAGNGLQNTRGALAMARTSDPHSATAQFFINYRHNSFLDRAKAQDGVGYAVFGKVIEGMGVIDKMAARGTTQKIVNASDGRGGFVRAPFRDVPSEDIIILSAKRAE